ncbi:MAG: LptE family protein [Bacteroidales bacterium]|nr:LptE family protein [Bacteroidales bacterium]
MTRRILLLLICVAGLSSCKVSYSFSGTSIQEDVNTISINYIEYKAMRVNPNLSNELTEALRNQFRRMTRLEQVELDGDMDIAGEITGYDISPAAVTADDVAARNKLTVTVKIVFTNRKYPEDDFNKSFSAYAEYDSTNTIDAVESALCAEIVEKLVEDIFNASVAQW